MHVEGHVELCTGNNEILALAAASVQARTLAYSWYVLQVGGWHDSINTEATASFFEKVKVDPPGATEADTAEDDGAESEHDDHIK